MSDNYLQKINIRNKKAGFQFQILDRFEAGIILSGTEIKSIRQGKVNINEAYCVFKKQELFIKAMNIAEYKMANQFNHEPTRARKLLLKKRELAKLNQKVKEKGLTIIPIRLFISARGFAKIEVALAKGKKVFDKRNSIKERDNKRDLARMMNR